MTKKAMKIYNTYCDKLNTEVFMYEQGFIDFSKLQEYLYTKEHEFLELVTQMYHYNLLSESDFDELFDKAFPKTCEIIDNILGITV